MTLFNVLAERAHGIYKEAAEYDCRAGLDEAVFVLYLGCPSGEEGEVFIEWGASLRLCMTSTTHTRNTRCPHNYI